MPQVYHESAQGKPSPSTKHYPCAGYAAAMACDPGAIDAALAAAVGDEPLLIAELRTAFRDSALRGLATLESAGERDGWQAAAWRLKGLAASFGAVRLMALAEEAGAAAPCDAAILRKLRRLVARL